MVYITRANYIKFIENKSDDLEVKDSLSYINPELRPAYHFLRGCKHLSSDYSNITIPSEIKAQGIDVVNEFRAWFKKYNNKELKDDVFLALLQAKWGNVSSPLEIILENSGMIEKADLTSRELNDYGFRPCIMCIEILDDFYVQDPFNFDEESLIEISNLDQDDELDEFDEYDDHDEYLSAAKAHGYNSIEEAERAGFFESDDWNLGDDKTDDIDIFEHDYDEMEEEQRKKRAQKGYYS